MLRTKIKENSLFRKNKQFVTDLELFNYLTQIKDRDFFKSAHLKLSYNLILIPRSHGTVNLAAKNRY